MAHDHSVFPLDSVKLIWDHITGTKKSPIGDVAKAACDVLCYATHMVFEDGPKVWADAPPLGDCKEDLANEFAYVVPLYEMPGVSAAGGVNWLRWVNLLIKFLPLILAEEQK